ncbi:MAG TPA: hypothetical protein VFU04_01450 [Solirubrobacterales bacterium]|nr:hypothetical protein [Solirubrobacterales bacterium]
MLRRPRQINAEPGRLVERLRSAADVVRWPFERAAWVVEERLVWPLQERVVWPLRERIAGVGLPARPTSPAALALIAVAILAIGVAALADRGSDEGALPGAEPVVSYAPVPAPAPDEEKPTGPVLHGVAPDFDVEPGARVATPDTSDSSDAASEAADGSVASDDGAAADGATTDDAEAEAGATASSKKSVPAGPAAMKVARRFSEAFVFYEIGERPARAMAVFQETASPDLATALAERPPRQPQGTEVPKARVLNLVPGPRQGKAYTVSASLLRVGTVSELRLKLARQAGAWVVTDVRG